MRRLYLFLVAVLGIFAVFSVAPPAYAADHPPAAFSHADIATGVSIVVGSAAAHVGTLLTKLHSPQYVKATVTYLLGTLLGILTTVVWAPDASWAMYARDVFFALGSQVVMHYTGATNWLAAKTANFGLTARRADPLRDTGVRAELGRNVYTEDDVARQGGT